MNISITTDYATEHCMVDSTIYNILAEKPDYTLFQAIHLHGSLIEEVECFIGIAGNPHKEFGYKTWRRTSEALEEWRAYVEKRKED